MEVLSEELPFELRERRQWVLWSWIWNGKKFDKPPLKLNGRNASTTNPKTWCTFEEAITAHQRGDFDGCGAVISAPYVGVDLDDCRDPETGELSGFAEFVIRTLDSYTEISPSGKGVKTWIRATLKTERKVDHSKGIEIYDGGRYFTTTGHRIENTPAEIHDRQFELDYLLEVLSATDVRDDDSGLSDRDLILDALEHMSPARAVGYTDWLAVGMALHAFDSSPAMMDEWDRWSQRGGDKYESGACAKKWRSFKSKGLGSGSLVHWAKQDGWSPSRKRVSNNGKAPQRTNETLAEIVEGPERRDAYLRSQLRKLWRRWFQTHGPGVFSDDEQHAEIYQIVWCQNVAKCRPEMDPDEFLRLVNVVRDSVRVEASKQVDDEGTRLTDLGLEFRDGEWWPGLWRIEVVESDPPEVRLYVPKLEGRVDLYIDAFDDAQKVHLAVLVKSKGAICLSDRPGRWPAIWNGSRGDKKLKVPPTVGLKAKLLAAASRIPSPRELTRQHEISDFIWSMIGEARVRETPGKNDKFFRDGEGMLWISFSELEVKSKLFGRDFTRNELSKILRECGAEDNRLPSGSRKRFLVLSKKAQEALQSFAFGPATPN